ncbi:MAG: peptidoglycan DD-metalloendopeptidase family protein [Acidimicrobiia bacterium]
MGAALVALALAAMVALPVSVAASPKDEVQAAENRLAQIDDELGIQESELERIESDLSLAATQLAEAESAYQETTHQLELVREEVSIVADRFARIQALLEERARLGFMDTTTELEVLLEASSMADLSDRAEFLDTIVGDDSDLAVEVENERVLLEARAGELQDLQAKRQQLVEQMRLRRDAIQTEFDRAADARQRLQDLRSEAEELLKSREAALERWKEAHPPEPEVVVGTGGSGGVSGPSPFDACPFPAGAVSNSFGAPREGHVHAGVDIFGPYGAPIVAPFSGTASVSSNGIGGIAVTVSSNEGLGYVYNAHLSKVGQTGAVGPGDVIGYNGDSGNAAGTSPHDHFEWHPPSVPPDVQTSPYGYSTVGNAVNPYPYLMQVC